MVNGENISNQLLKTNFAIYSFKQLHCLPQHTKAARNLDRGGLLCNINPRTNLCCSLKEWDCPQSAGLLIRLHEALHYALLACTFYFMVAAHNR